MGFFDQVKKNLGIGGEAGNADANDTKDATAAAADTESIREEAQAAHERIQQEKAEDTSTPNLEGAAQTLGQPDAPQFGTASFSGGGETMPADAAGTTEAVPAAAEPVSSEMYGQQEAAAAAISDQYAAGGANPNDPINTEISTGQSTYTVQEGDTLGEIAQRHGTTAERLAQANGINNPDLIFPGQELQV